MNYEYKLSADEDESERPSTPIVSGSTISTDVPGADYEKTADLVEKIDKYVKK